MLRPPLPSRKYSWYLFLLQAVSTARLDGYKEIEPATFQL